MTRILHRVMLPALLTGMMWATTACTDDESYVAESGDCLTFNVSVKKEWQNGHSRAALPRDTVQALKGGEAFADSLFLHTLVTDGIEQKPQGDSTLIGRAASVTSISNFKLFAHAYTGTWEENKSTSCPDYIYDYEVEHPDYATSYYWPIGKSLRFFAYAPADFITKTANADFTPNFSISRKTEAGAPTLTYTVPADVSKQHDLLVAAPAEQTQISVGAVPLTFNHALTAVKFACDKNMGEGKITAIRLIGVYGKATYFFSDEDWDDHGIITNFEQKNLDIATRPGSDTNYPPITDENQTFMMLPQTLPSGAKIEIDYDNGSKHTLSHDINGTSWPQGATVTYLVSTSSLNWTYRFYWSQKPEVTSFPYSGGTTTYQLLSTRTMKGGATENVGWKATYFVDGSTEEVDKLPWVTITDNSITIGAQTPGYQNHDEELQKNQPQGEPDSPYDLSLDGGTTMTTANCYVVNAAGTYSLPLVYGNAIKNGIDNTQAYKLEADTKDYTLNEFIDHAGGVIDNPWIATKYVPASAGLIWQDAFGLIADVQLKWLASDNSLKDIAEIDVADKALSDFKERYRIVFTTIGEDDIVQGNAIIAVKDEQGNVLWSWHIWVTDYMLGDDLYQIISPKTNLNYQLMPYNLGWCSFDGKITYDSRKVTIRITQDGSGNYLDIPIEQTGGEESTVGGNSPYYQWGRKDPMMPNDGTNMSKWKNCYDLNGDIVPFQSVTSSFTSADDMIKEGIYTPGSFIKNNKNYYVNLWATTYDEWNGGFTNHSEKSVYDPCPKGYKIPIKDVFYALFGSENNLDLDFYTPGLWDNSLNGIYWTDVNGKKIFLSTQGYIYEEGLWNVGGGVMFYTSEGFGTELGCSFFSYKNGIYISVWVNDSSQRHFAAPIRPVKE